LDARSEGELLAACRAGDQTACAALIKRHAQQVLAICVGMVTNAHDAEDVAQEALAQAFTRIPALRDPEQFGPWLARIARNACIDLLRRRTRERRVLAEQVRPDRSGLADTTGLERAIAQLPEKYRLALLLYYFDGQSTENVAKMLNLSPAGVSTRLSRARRELRKLLTEHGVAE